MDFLSFNFILPLLVQLHIFLAALCIVCQPHSSAAMSPTTKIAVSSTTLPWQFKIGPRRQIYGTPTV